MEEKNLEEKDPKNNMDSEQTQTIEESNLNEDIEFIYTSLDRKRRSYKLSYDDKKLEELSDTGIKKYVQDNYLKKDLDNNKLLKDIATFKTFRDNLKEDMDNKNNLYSSISNLAIAFSTSVLTVVVSFDFKYKIILALLLAGIIIIAAICLIKKLICFDYNRKKNSKFNVLKIVSESIYILEYKKEKLTQKLEDKNK